MLFSLTLHPNSTCVAVTAITVQVLPSASTLTLRYALSGDISKIILPSQTEPRRTDDLWQHTCFEAFITTPNDAGYLELNVSPSTQWAAYRFTGYREGMSAADIPQPQMDLQCDERLMVVSITLQSVIPIRLGLSAVIEEHNGRKSYWALAHPSSQPDFHHRDGFVIELS